MANLDGSELVFAVRRGRVEAVLGPMDNWCEFKPVAAAGGPQALEELLASGRFWRRTAELESDREWLQVIPYVVPVFTDRIFVYRRPAAGGDARLRRRLAMGLGGHVNPPDAGATVAAGAEMLLACARRELAQEVGTAAGPFKPVGYVRDDRDEVGGVHLGVVVVWVPAEPAAMAGSAEVIPLEPEPVIGAAPSTAPWFTAAEVAGLSAEMEGWSQVLSEHAGWLVRAAESVSPRVCQERRAIDLRCPECGEIRRPVISPLCPDVVLVLCDGCYARHIDDGFRAELERLVGTDTERLKEERVGRLRSALNTRFDLF